MPSWHHPRRALARLVRVGLALAAALIVAGCGAVPTTATRRTPTVAPTAAPPLGGSHIVPTLTGISMVSRDEGWIIGRDGYYNGIGAFLLHYRGGIWSRQDFPPLVDAALATPTSIAMVAADTGWIAVAVAPNYSPVVLHERAGGWLTDRLPDTAGIVTSLSAATADDAWALSTDVAPASGTPTSTILRYHAGQWAVEAALPNTYLTALSMGSADDGWAAGSDGAGPVLLHYASGSWARVRPSALSGVAALTGLSMSSVSDGWATGMAPLPGQTCTECGGPSQVRVILRYHDGQWQPVRETTGEGDNLRFTLDSDTGALRDPVVAGPDGAGWVARGALVHFAPDGQQEVFHSTCKSDLVGLAVAPSPSGAAPEAWVIGSNGQLFHLAGDVLTRYDTGAHCDPLS